ncbi:four helix bundle protein [Patescibacteria group bacterium]|nr:four helix bundle protein [Patescibacteria group bacterium]
MSKNFRDLEIWQLGLKLLIRVYKLTRDFPRSERYGLVDQIRRCANSIIANIAESYGRYHFADKIRTLYFSRGEVFEMRSHLSVACELKYIKKGEFDGLDSDYEILAKKVNSYIKYLKGRKRLE